MKNQTTPTFQFFQHGAEEAFVFTTDSYIRIDRFATGDANHADRQTMRVRLLAAIELSKRFEFNYDLHVILTESVKNIVGYKVQKKREERKLTPVDMVFLRWAIIYTDRLMEQATYWEQVQAYKAAEDQCFIDSDKVIYELQTIH